MVNKRIRKNSDLMSLYDMYFKHVLHPISAYKKINQAIDESYRYRELLVESAYSFITLNLKEHTTLIDIGAYIGDSAMLFAQFKDIDRVIAFEPNKKAYNRALYCNLQMPTNVARKILYKNVAIGSINKMSNQLRDDYSSEYMDLNEWMCYKRMAIKCDTEGSEYEIFNKDLNLKDVYLVQIEYHYGVQNILNVLNSKGFSVTFTDPKVWSDSRNKPGSIGMIYAIRD